MEGIGDWVLKVIGATLGVLASLIIIAPISLRNGAYRGMVGVVMGVVFSPVITQIGWLSSFHGTTMELVVARSAFTGFVVWFILEIIARALSSDKVIESLVAELIRIRGRK